MIHVDIIPTLKDNYTYILRAENGDVGIVDAPEVLPVVDFLESHSIKPTIIFNTHHHGDHIDGNEELMQKYGCTLAAPGNEPRIAHVAIPLLETTDLTFGGERAKILETPGHTRSHIVLHFPQSKILFTGDTLFSMGCGRLFEGSAQQMWESLQKIAALPDDTLIYCGHEYTLANAKFCLGLEPENADLHARIAECEMLRNAGKPTLPVTLETEKKTNAFLRAGSAEKFAELRSLKDQF